MNAGISSSSPLLSLLELTVKYVNLEKSVKMLCEYNNKFKRWIPKKCVQNKEKVVTMGHLRTLLSEENKGYEKKKYSGNIYVQKYRK